MPKLKARSIFLLSLLLFTITLLPVRGKCGGPERKIWVETNPRNIKANQPFKLIFHMDGVGIWYNNAHPEILNPSTNDCLVMYSLGSKMSTTRSTGRLLSNYTFTYLLVPKHAGDLIIMPWTIKFDTGMIYVSDTFQIHILSEKISAPDSLAQLEEIKKQHPPTFTQQEIQQMLPLSPESIRILRKDSIFIVNPADTFQVSYTVNSINASGFSPDEITKVYAHYLPYPQGLSLISSGWVKINFNEKLEMGDHPTTRDLEFSGEYNINLLAVKSGIYTLPETTFTYIDKKYTAPPIKVIVK
jgi:hypothetical protein